MASYSSLSQALLLLAGVAALPVIGGSMFTMMQTRSMGELTPIHEDLPAPPPPPPPVASDRPPAPPPREVDQAVFRKMEQAMTGPRLTDVDPRAPFRIDLVGDGRIAVGAEVDLDRDGRWDEIWSFFPLQRRVSPDDDGKHSELLRWDGREWQPEASAGE